MVLLSRSMVFFFFGDGRVTGSVVVLVGECKVDCCE